MEMVILSALVERFSVFHMRDVLLLIWSYYLYGAFLKYLKKNKRLRANIPTQYFEIHMYLSLKCFLGGSNIAIS